MADQQGNPNSFGRYPDSTSTTPHPYPGTVTEGSLLRNLTIADGVGSDGYNSMFNAEHHARHVAEYAQDTDMTDAFIKEEDMGEFDDNGTIHNAVSKHP